MSKEIDYVKLVADVLNEPKYQGEKWRIVKRDEKRVSLTLGEQPPTMGFMLVVDAMRDKRWHEQSVRNGANWLIENARRNAA